MILFEGGRWFPDEPSHTTKVYIVTEGDYSAYHIVKCCATKGAAIMFAKEQAIADNYDLLRRTKRYRYSWYQDNDNQYHQDILKIEEDIQSLKNMTFEHILSSVDIGTTNNSGDNKEYYEKLGFYIEEYELLHD